METFVLISEKGISGTIGNKGWIDDVILKLIICLDFTLRYAFIGHIEGGSINKLRRVELTD